MLSFISQSAATIWNKHAFTKWICSTTSWDAHNTVSSVASEQINLCKILVLAVCDQMMYWSLSHSESKYVLTLNWCCLQGRSTFLKESETYFCLTTWKICIKLTNGYPNCDIILLCRLSQECLISTNLCIELAEKVN